MLHLEKIGDLYMCVSAEAIVIIKHSRFPDVESWLLCVRDAVWLRNQVVAPLTEELVFRGAMLPMLLPCSGSTAAVFTAPLFFGVGHLVGPVLCHSFCNSQGLPDIASALQHPQRSALLSFYLVGALLFLVLLFPLTDPYFYTSIPVCSLAPLPPSAC
ncbi:CAAX prenyl protease 2 [Oryzias melastigma]|uniref:CAAX prenyl protease 2 n=1 Tax=Oryzias melastigma TaxID=30732 RepID=UPI00168CCA3F|nr:CAAX prenyl protease 2 [Oryzias melastigma]